MKNFSLLTILKFENILDNETTNFTLKQAKWGVIFDSDPSVSCKKRSNASILSFNMKLKKTILLFHKY